MTELICTNGHVYKGEKCDRCGSSVPVNEVSAPENEASVGVAPVKEKSVRVRKPRVESKPAKKTAPKAKKGKK